MARPAPPKLPKSGPQSAAASTGLSKAAQKPVAGPPARRAVVLRQGPPPSRGRWRDLAVGLVGLLLILASGVLAVRLPRTDVLPPQFKVTFETSAVSMPGQARMFNTTPEKSSHQEFVYNITADDVLQVSFEVHFADDVPASDPDRFSVWLYDPDGNPEGEVRILSNPPPAQNTTPGAPSLYEARPLSTTFDIGVHAKPDDTIVDGELNSTEASVAANQERLAHFITHGEWRIKVVLLAAGDCPNPVSSPGPDTATRAAACAQENSAAKDPTKDTGNPFTVGSFSYVRFSASAQRL